MILNFRRRGIMVKKSALLLLISAIIFTCGVKSFAAPYQSYTYSYWGEPVPAPYSYLPSKVINGSDLGIDHFRNPADIFVNEAGEVYVLDSGNNRVVIMDKNFKLIRIIESFNNGDRFNNPRGIFVTHNGELYVADTANNRIVVMSTEGEYKREFGPPKSDIIPESFVYLPDKLVVDRAGRIYVIAQNVNQGIIELSNNGHFQAYIGATLARFNAADLFWRTFSTDEQRRRSRLFLPTEYNNIAIDNRGFLYTTTSALSIWDIRGAINYRSRGDYNAPVRKLNPSGLGIMRRLGAFPPVGEIKINTRGSITGQSTFIDVAYGGYGIYSVLDRKRGRVFTYDHDGNLLHIFGGLGNRMGTFRTPTSLDYLGQQILVLDSGLNNITVFEMTDYCKMLTEAVTLHYRGRYDESLIKWQEIIKYNVNLDIVHVGLGKAYFEQDDYRMAMKHFLLGNDRESYSKAYKLYRKEVLDRYFGLLIIVIIVLVYILKRVMRYISNVNSQRVGG